MEHVLAEKDCRPRTGKIVATMLSGNSERLVGEAVRSVVDWVDEVLLIDTGIADETATIVAREAGGKFFRVEFPWRNDFAAARNAALQIAAERGATWALTVDTDERLEFDGIGPANGTVAGCGGGGTETAEPLRPSVPGRAWNEGRRDGAAALREALAAEPEVLSWLVMASDGSYAKERLIRVPTTLAWRGRTHEALCGAHSQQRRVLPGASFWEVRKSPEAYRAKLERDLAILREETRDQPNNARWWFYLGQTLEGLRQPADAAEAYQRCAELDGWAEQAAWACYKAAKCLSALKQFRAAERACAIGLARQPGSPELAWLAGWCCYQRRADRDAIAWARMAITLGDFDGIRAGRDRISFRHLPGWYEAPYDVLRFALRRLGEDDAARQAELQFDAARRAREAATAGAAEKPRDHPPATGRRVLLDLGGHHGEGLARMIAELGVDADWEVHSFEPNPACRLAERLAHLPIPVKVHEAAAWTHDGVVSFRQQADSTDRAATPGSLASSGVDGWGSCLSPLDSRHPGLQPPIEVPCVDLARLIGSFPPDAHVVVKMDIEGAEFTVLRHLLANGVASRIARLYVEWHERLLPAESPATRDALVNDLNAAGVAVFAWD